MTTSRSNTKALADQRRKAQSAEEASRLDVPGIRETAADFAKRELEEIAQRMEIVSNRLSAAKKRLQSHFGVPLTDSTPTSGGGIQQPPRAPGMDGVRQQFDEIDARLHSIADGLEELI
jgi:hypothetical protein